VRCCVRSDTFTMGGATPDPMAFLFSFIGGFSMGTYPVPIKAPSVLAAHVHPMIFQCYKSFWVFVLGFMFIFLNLYRSLPAYVFSYWGVLGAVAWIPSGLMTIASVPRLGVGMAIVINTGTSATLQFIVGQLAGHETMKKHEINGHEYVLAPYFLVCVIIGMAGLVISPTLKCGERRLVAELSVSLPAAPGREAAAIENEIQVTSGRPQEAGGAAAKTDLIIGLSCAVIAGVFSALQFAVITIGKQVEGCTDCHGYTGVDRPDCPAACIGFDSFGSYMTSFGIGAGIMTPMYLGLFVSTEVCQSKEMPQSHFSVLRILGSIAGWCWVAGNCFQSAAVNRGGDSVMGPANQAIQLITSGAWGLIYYKEVKDPKRILCWVLSAAWTVLFVILLGREKQ